MPIKAQNLIIGFKEEPKKVPPETNNLDSIHKKLEQLAKEAERERIKAENTAIKIVRNKPFEEKVEDKKHYEIIKDGDLVKHHNTKSHYLNDMTGFEF